MRKYIAALVASAFLLLVLSAAAQAPRSQRSTTTTTTTTTTTATGPEHHIEGCIVKESTDFFLIPQRGRPFKLQSNQDLSANEGHRVSVSGKEMPLTSAANAAGNVGVAGNTAASTGSGNDLHSLSDRQIIVDGVNSIANTCPVNWNPILPRR